MAGLSSSAARTAHTIDNSREGFARLHRWLIGQQVDPEKAVTCMENTGIYGRRLLAAMSSYGWKCAVEHTSIIDKVSPNHHRKDDRYDAELIAEYAARFTDKLHLQCPAEEELEQLSRLYAEQSRLIRQRTSTKTKQTQSGQYPTDNQFLQDNWSNNLRSITNK